MEISIPVLLRIILVGGMGSLLLFDHKRKNGEQYPLTRLGLAILAVGSLGLLLYLVSKHLSFPLHLEVMEGTVLQHFYRAASLKPIYPDPSPAFVPLAYNPLYYYSAIPFSLVTGRSLLTLRIFSSLGFAGSIVSMYLMVQRETRSRWWALVAAGLFAAAYRVMDVYLDTAHSDSWFLFSALLGTYLLARKGSNRSQFAGFTILIASFWFKQHGAIFVVGATLYLTWRDGPRKSVRYWVMALLLGPVLYFVVAPRILGSRFLYFTLEVPSQWSEFGWMTFRRIGALVVKSYPILTLSAVVSTIWLFSKPKAKSRIYYVQGLAAGLSALLGAADPGSSNNVFIPLGAWLILLGVVGLYQLGQSSSWLSTFGGQYAGLALSFALLAYNPIPLIIRSDAREVYNDLVQQINDLDGQVYAPSQGFLGEDAALFPNAHWVALEDMIRGPGRSTENHPLTRKMLAPALSPPGDAYVLTNYPLGTYPWMAFLNDDYVLEQDYGDRFIALRTLPGRWDSGWPRYLYRYKPPG